MHYRMILCFLLSFTGIGAAADPNPISINCGGAEPATGRSGRKWGGDAAAPRGKFHETYVQADRLFLCASTLKGELNSAIDPVSYRTQFSYSFELSPGQTFILLHFNPVPYHGFESSNFFTVEIFTLAADFSPSVTARALSLNVVVKEFCIDVQENVALNILFPPVTSPLKNNYESIYGIDITVSAPSIITNVGVPVLGQKSVIHVDSSTVLERVHYQHIKWGSVSSSDDIGGMFRMWAESTLKRNAEMAYSKTWRVPVDVGFRYLVRLHFCEVELEMDFVLLINNIVSLTSADMLQQKGSKNILWYNDYVVMVEGLKQEDKRDISISLHSPHEFLDRHGPLEGFEVFKLSNDDRTLASPSLLIPREDSPSQTLQDQLYDLHARMSLFAYTIILQICSIAIIVSLEHKMLEHTFTKENSKPSAREKRPCRLFSVAEIQSVTENFHFLGRGELGKVYKGHIDNGRDIVERKRLKPGSEQWERQFWTEVEILSEQWERQFWTEVEMLSEQWERQVWTEVEMLSELRLFFYYMPFGTFADHLYKLNDENYPLSWKQRLKICIEAASALIYLHTGHRIIHRGSESLSQYIKNLRATFGHLDSIYFKTPKLTEKSDKYYFGALLVEVLCGRPAPPWNEQDKQGRCYRSHIYQGFLDEKSYGKAGSRKRFAVEKLNSESMQGLEEWQSTVNFLGRLSNNIVIELLDYNLEDIELLLDDEFMPKGSLKNHLFWSKGLNSYQDQLYWDPWDIELKTSSGAARAVASNRAIFYRDLKPPNVLLDGSYNAKLSDFGLAKMGPTASGSHVKPQVMLTYGYFDLEYIEYIATGHLNVKSDVYGFGVVLLEMMRGSHALDTNSPSGQHGLGDWIESHLSERRTLKHIADVCLHGMHPSESALHIAQLALTCLESEPKPENRSSMQDIVETLERITSSSERPRVYFGD